MTCRRRKRQRCDVGRIRGVQQVATLPNALRAVRSRCCVRVRKSVAVFHAWLSFDDAVTVFLFGFFVIIRSFVWFFVHSWSGVRPSVHLSVVAYG